MIHYDNLVSSIQNYTPNMHTYVYIHISMYRKDVYDIVYDIILLEVVFQEFGELGIRDEAINLNSLGEGLQPKSHGLQPNSDGNGLEPASRGLQEVFWISGRLPLYY